MIFHYIYCLFVSQSNCVKLMSLVRCFTIMMCEKNYYQTRDVDPVYVDHTTLNSQSINLFRAGAPRVVVSAAALHVRIPGSFPGLGGLKETKKFLPHPLVKLSIVGRNRDREVACSASDRQVSNFESCVWSVVSSHSSHHPQEILLAQFSLYVHKSGLNTAKARFILFYFISNLISGPTKALFNPHRS